MNSCSASSVPALPSRRGRTRKLAKPRKRFMQWHGSPLTERHTTQTKEAVSSSSCCLTTNGEPPIVRDLAPILPEPQNAASGLASATQAAGVHNLASDVVSNAFEKTSIEKRADSNTASSCREKVQQLFKDDLADDIKTEIVNEFTVEHWCDLGVGGSIEQPSPLPHGSPDSGEKIETVEPPPAEPCRRDHSTECLDTLSLTSEKDHDTEKLSGQPYNKANELSDKGTCLSDTILDNKDYLKDIKTDKTKNKLEINQIPEKKLKSRFTYYENTSTGENIKQKKDAKQISPTLHGRCEVDISNFNQQSPVCKPLPRYPTFTSANPNNLQPGPQAPELPSLWSLLYRSGMESGQPGDAERCPAKPALYPCLANLALVNLPHCTFPQPTATHIQSPNIERANPGKVSSTVRDSVDTTEPIRTETGRPEPTTPITTDTIQPGLRTPSYGLGIASIRYPTNETGVPFQNVVYPSSFGYFHIDTSQSAGLVLMPSQPYFIQPLPFLPFLPAVVSTSANTALTQTEFQGVQAAIGQPCQSLCSAGTTTTSGQTRPCPSLCSAGTTTTSGQTRSCPSLCSAGTTTTSGQIFNRNQSDPAQSHALPVSEANLPTATSHSSRAKERSKSRSTDFVDPTSLKFGVDDTGDDDHTHPGDCSDHSDQEWQPRSARFKIPMSCTSVDGETHNTVTNSKVQKKNRRQGQQPPPTCEVCGKVFKGTYYLRRHQLSHAEVRPYQCPQCHKSFRQKAHLMGHQNVHLRAVQHKLDEIPSSSSKPKSTTAAARCPGRPRKIYANLELSCKECGKTFKTVYRLKRHEMSHTDHRPFVCRVCGKGFKQTGHRNEHEANHETKNKRRFLCNHCGVVFRCRSSFNNHRRLHAREHSDKPDLLTGLGLKDQQSETLAVVLTGYDCPYCAEKFATAQALNNHLDTHVEVQQRRHVQPYSCHVCKRSFTYRHNLLKHALMHKVPGKFAQFFKEKMEAHVASGKPCYKCSKCSKIFLRKETMVKHGKIHLDFKPFRCPTCCREFTQNVHLKVHMRKHTGSRPFQCTECQKSFIDSTALAKHVEYEACSSDNSLYHCKICEKLHYYIGSLKQHIRREHAISEPEVPMYILRSEKASRRKQQPNSGRHVCKLCSSTFSEKCNLLRHIRRKHAALVALLQKEIGTNEVERVHVEKTVEGNVDGRADVDSKHSSQHRLLSETLSVTNETTKTEEVHHDKIPAFEIPHHQSVCGQENNQTFEMPHHQLVCGQENNQTFEADRNIAVEMSKGTSSKICSLLPLSISRILSVPCKLQPVSFHCSPTKVEHHQPQTYQSNTPSQRRTAEENRTTSSSTMTDNLSASVDGVQAAKKTCDSQDTLKERSKLKSDWISQSDTCDQRQDRTSPFEQDLVSPVNDINFLYNIGLIVSRKASCCKDSPMEDASLREGHGHSRSKIVPSMTDEHVEYLSGERGLSNGLVQQPTIDATRVKDMNSPEDAIPASNRPEAVNVASTVRAHDDLPCNMDYDTRPQDSNRGGDFRKQSNLIVPQETTRCQSKTPSNSDHTDSNFQYQPADQQLLLVPDHCSNKDSGDVIIHLETTSSDRPCVPDKDTIGPAAAVSTVLISLDKESSLSIGGSSGKCPHSNLGSVPAKIVPLGAETTGTQCCQVGKSDPLLDPPTQRWTLGSSPRRSGFSQQQSESEVSDLRKKESDLLEPPQSLPPPLAAQSDCTGRTDVVQTSSALQATENRHGFSRDAGTITHQVTRGRDELQCQPHTKDASALEDLTKKYRPWLEELLCCSRPKKSRQLNSNIRLRGEVNIRCNRATIQQRPKLSTFPVEFQQPRTAVRMTRSSPSNGLSGELYVGGIQSKHSIQQTETAELKDTLQTKCVSDADLILSQPALTETANNSLRLPPGSLQDTGTAGLQVTMNVSLNAASIYERTSSSMATCCATKTGPDDRTLVRDGTKSESPPFSATPVVSEQTVAEGRQQFACTSCQKLFTARHQLKRHQMTHTDLRPHSCPECGRGFRQKIHMSDHMKRHIGQRPFLCTGCDKRFILKNELNQHLKNHCKGKPLATTAGFQGNPPLSDSDVSRFTGCVDHEPDCSLHLDPSFLLAFGREGPIFSVPEAHATRNPQIKLVPADGRTA